MSTIVKEDILPTKVELSGAQRSRLEERLQRARNATARPAEAPGIPRRTSQENLPLSFAQEGLWFLDQLEPGSAAYNVFQALRLKGELNLPALEKALNEIVRRHEILRTNFVAADGAGVQVIAPTRSLTLTVTDLAERVDAASHEELQRALREESRRPFEFTRDMLLRALLVRVKADEHVLMLTMHHIISDGWSLGLLFRELAALYPAFARGEPSPLPELPIQFADFALWERTHLREAQFEKSLAYWKKQLGGTLPALDLPCDHPRSTLPTSRGGMQTVDLPRPLGEALKTLGQQEGATLYMTLLAAFKVLLHRWTGQEDIVVGSVVAGRRKVELEKLIGFFVNTIVLRSDLSGNPTFRQLLARVRDGAVAAMAHQDLPFERLVKELRPDRSLSRNPLFQVLFVLQNAPMAPAELPGLTLESIDVDNATTKFDLTLSMIETREGLRAALEYNADIFEPATISRLFGCLQTLLEGIVAQPDLTISKLPLLVPAEQHQLVTGWNRTRSDYPRDQTIAQLFDEQVARVPHAVAVVFGGDTLSYSQLDRRASQLARRLRQAGVGPDTLVAVCMDRSLDLIVALLGILKAGGAYVSLDPAYPAERLAFMLGDCRAPVLLTHAAQRATVDGAMAASRSQSLRPAQIISLDSDWPAIARESDAPLEPAGGPENLAYVSYTSGSTGRPKGVCVPHRGVVRLVKNTDYARFDTDEVFLQLAPVAFDASTFEIWGPLLNGGRLVVHPPGLASLAELGEAIESNGITTLWLTSGLFHQMVEEQVDRLKHVRQLLTGGDVLSVAHVTRALEHLPRTQIINGYGPTENTTFTTCHRITTAPLPGRSIPIGRPIANTQVYILDREMQPVPMGVPGELYTGGDGLAREYLNRPELTKEKFVPNPFAKGTRTEGDGLNPTPHGEPEPRLYRTGDLARWLPDGTIEFLGRLDRQVKIRGFRVEPAEIEAILATHPVVKECAVVPQPDAAGGKSLVAYVVPKSLPAPEPNAWRVFLEGKVPEHLLPSAFVTLETLPLNANGKLDVAALPVGDGSRAAIASGYVAPRDEVEKQLAEIWSNVLGVNPIGIHDRFFDLGGHSLLAVRMVAQVDRKFGKKLPVAAIFQHRTIELLARLLRTNAARYAPVTSVVEIQGQGRRPPVYLVHGVGGGMFWGYSNLSRHMGVDQPVYGFKSRGLDGLPEWPTIEEMAANYLIDLRAQQAKGPYYLGGYCFGGVVAYEMARQLHAQGQEVAFLALINCSPPNTTYHVPGNRRSLGWQLKFIRNLLYWAGCFFFRWSMKERTDFVRWKLRVVRRKASEPAAEDAKEILTDIDELLNLADYSDRQREVWQEHVRALFNYHPQPYAGRVTLFRTGGHPLFSSFDEEFGWGELAQGGVEVRVMPGGHGNILDEPHVRTVAQSFQACLRRLAP